STLWFALTSAGHHRVVGFGEGTDVSRLASLVQRLLSDSGTGLLDCTSRFRMIACLFDIDDSRGKVTRFCPIGDERDPPGARPGKMGGRGHARSRDLAGLGPVRSFDFRPGSRRQAPNAPGQGGTAATPHDARNAQELRSFGAALVLGQSPLADRP